MTDNNRAAEVAMNFIVAPREGSRVAEFERDMIDSIAHTLREVVGAISDENKRVDWSRLLITARSSEQVDGIEINVRVRTLPDGFIVPPSSEADRWALARKSSREHDERRSEWIRMLEQRLADAERDVRLLLNTASSWPRWSRRRRQLMRALRR